MAIEPAAVVSEVAFGAPAGTSATAHAATGYVVIVEFEIASPASVVIRFAVPVGSAPV